MSDQKPTRLQYMEQRLLGAKRAVEIGIRFDKMPDGKWRLYDRASDYMTTAPTLDDLFAIVYTRWVRSTGKG